MSATLLTMSCLPRPLADPLLPWYTGFATAIPFQLVSSSPVNGLVLGAAESVRVVFSHPVVAKSCSIGSGTTLAGGTLSESGDTVIVSPPGSWATGIGQTLTLTGCQDGTGATVAVSLSFQVASGIVYISPAGTDAGPSTPSSPWRTLVYAVANCASDCAIYARGGGAPYPRDSATTVGARYALIGGWDSTYSTWDPATYPTTFADTSGATGTSASDPTFALFLRGQGRSYLRSIRVVAGSGAAFPSYTSAVWIQDSLALFHDVTALGCQSGCGNVSVGTAVLLDSTVGGLTGLFLGASTLDGGSCTAAGCSTTALRDNGTFSQGLAMAASKLTGGAALGTSRAVQITAPKDPFEITSSYINGGISATPYGIYQTGGLTAPVIQGSFIVGGAASGVTWGLWLTDYSGSLVNNIVHAGISTTASTYAVQAGGPLFTGKVYNNLFHLGVPGGSSASAGLFITTTSDPDLQNNLFVGWAGASGTRQGISFTTGVPTAFVSNGFSDCTEAAHGNGMSFNTVNSSGALCTDGTCSLPVVPGGNQGNVIAASSPGWVQPDITQPGMNFHFRADGTSLCAVTRGGAALPTVTSDMGLAPRTAPYSMGPYEYDGPCQ